MQGIAADFFDIVYGFLRNNSGVSEDALIITDNAGAFSTLMTSVNPLWNYLSILGIGLTLIYFLMEMNQKLALEGRDINLKSFFAPFLKLLIAVAVLGNMGSITGIILQLNDNMITTIANDPVFTGGATTSTCAGVGVCAGCIECTDEIMHTAIEDSGFFTAIFLVLVLLLMWVICMVLSLVWNYKGLVYKLELLFRIAIVPLAAADVYSGNHSSAIKYLKGLLAHGVYGVSLVIIPMIALDVASASFVAATDGFQIIGSLCTFLVAPFAALGVSGAAKQVVKEALGA